MDNVQIADSLSLLSKLMDIHGENSFKSKSYASAAFALERLAIPVSELSMDKLAAIKGIGQSSAQKIREMADSGKLQILESLISQTPPGVIDMLQIKGIGPKKIHSIWKEMGIETVGELLYACQENRLKMYKGFGEKTQQNVMESIRFYQQHEHQQLYAQAEPLVPVFQSFLEKCFPDTGILLTGAMARQMETLETLDFIIELPAAQIQLVIDRVPEFQYIPDSANPLQYKTGTGITLGLYGVKAGKSFIASHIQHSSSELFWNALTENYPIPGDNVKNEEAFFAKLNMQKIPAAARESVEALKLAAAGNFPELITEKDIRGIIHSHSNWSDGSQSLEEMARTAMAEGYEYLVISDHSQSAFYANGLNADRIAAQHAQIDALNKSLHPFRIFKSIEADILNDGSLDYPDDILASFDLVIASVHSNLKMTEEKAMMRLLKAIENPYTRILGHMTGRLLLSRPGYPVNHNRVIDACAANDVVIELNANPNRLDIDWRHIAYALEKNVLISINPDAHHTDGYHDNAYGVRVAQKALLTKEKNLSSFSLEAFTAFVDKRKR